MVSIGENASLTKTDGRKKISQKLIFIGEMNAKIIFTLWQSGCFHR